MLQERERGEEEGLEALNLLIDIECVGAAGSAVHGGEVEIGGGLNVGLHDPCGEGEEGMLGWVWGGRIEEGVKIEPAGDGGFDEGAVGGFEDG